MSNIQVPRYNIVYDDGVATSVTLFIGSETMVASRDHSNFASIMERIGHPDTDIETLRGLFDIGKAISNKFHRLSERVTINAGRIFFDGDEVHNALTNAIVLFHGQCNENFAALVNFMEKIKTNPNLHSQEQLFEWLDRNSFGITPNGNFVGYKGVDRAWKGGFISRSAGTAFVNGERIKGQIPTNPGTIVEMPRSDVQHNPREACSTGLHVGDWGYASSFAAVTLAVEVNPRDVVSVPTDCNGAKLRCCRYVVLDQVRKPMDALLVVGQEQRIMASRAVPLTERTIIRRAPKPTPGTGARIVRPSNPVPKLLASANAAAEREAAAKAASALPAPDPATRAKAPRVVKKAAAPQSKKTVSPPSSYSKKDIEARAARPKGTSTKKAAVKKAAPVKKAPAVKKPISLKSDVLSAGAIKPPTKKAAPVVVKPPKFYEDYKLVNFMSESMTTLRWLAKEWNVKGLPSNPKKDEVAAALVRMAPRRRAQITRKSAGYKQTKTR
ncbi:MAG: hypothetical protein AB7O86_05935 [Porticoccaceae bacterium]